MSLHSFLWTHDYETGLPSVDQQHAKLVHMLNQLVEVLTKHQTPSQKEIVNLLNQLTDYATFHFADEERLMAKHHLPKEFIQTHQAQHADFTAYIVKTRQTFVEQSSPQNVLESLVNYITVWLSFHILGSDQAMAEQIQRKQNPSANPIPQHSRATRVLLDAVENFYQLMVARNNELLEVQNKLSELNKTLEERVAMRTKELSTALKEVEATKKRLLQSEKMSAIGQLAAGVAHEINNPVGFVSSNLNTLAQYVHNMLELLALLEQSPENQNQQIQKFKQSIDYDFLKEDVLDLLKESSDGLNRVKKIVQDMKVFSHVDCGQWQMENINTILESTINLVWHEIKYKAELIKEYDSNLPAISCLPAQLSQVFMNILVNATQAIDKEKGKIIVKTKKRNHVIEVQIQDNGKGMSPQVQKHIFEPFFTTKPVGKGTGLGMSLSYEIIQHHAGEVRLKSKEGQGTTFIVTLPIQQEKNAHCVFSKK